MLLEKSTFLVVVILTTPFNGMMANRRIAGRHRGWKRLPGARLSPPQDSESQVAKKPTEGKVAFNRVRICSVALTLSASSAIIKAPARGSNLLFRT
jgi:hypothetical protein